MAYVKSRNYTESEQQIYLLARALAHPARVRMIEKLKRSTYRNVDFSREFSMSASTVKKHIDKLRDANLIEVEYFLHSYSISLNQERLNELSSIMN